MRKKHKSGKNPVWLSVSVIVVIFLIAATVFALFTDIVRFQSAQRARISGDMLKKHTQQMYTDIRETFDQMILSVPLGRLMNYASCEAADLLVGLRQLDSIRDNIAAIDSIYLYNAESNRFFISSSHSLQAVQEFDQMFDAGAGDIVNNLRAYENMKPIVRSLTFTYPVYEKAEYVSYVRYNTLMKGATNVYIINVRAETFFEYTEIWPKTGADKMFFTNAEGKVLLSGGEYGDLFPLTERIMRENSACGEIFLPDGSLLSYDKLFPCGWTFAYALLPDSAGDVMTAGGTIRIFILAGLISVFILILVIIYRKWLSDVRERKRVEKAMAEERESVRLIQRRHAILRAVSGEGERAPGENTIARLMIIQGASDREKTAARLRMFFGEKLIFAEEDERGRLIACTQAHEEKTLADELRSLCAPEDTGGDMPFIVISEEFEYPQALSESYRWSEEMLSYEPLSGGENVFTPASAKAREEKITDIHAVSSAFLAGISQLDSKGACGILEEAVDRLSRSTISAYQTGVIRLALLVSESLSQLEKQYGIHMPDNQGVLTDLTPEEVKRTMMNAVHHAVQDVLDKRSARYDELTKEISLFIQENACDEAFTIDTVADRFELSGAYLSRLYKKQTGTSIAESILSARIAKAKEILENTNEPVAGIAAGVGFTDAQYFYRVFKKATGETPGQYRRGAKRSQDNEQGDAEYDE